MSLNTWHVIRASRNGRFGTLKVNNDRVVNGTSKGPFSMLKLRQPLFVGGVKYFSDIPIGVEIHNHFRGCIEKVSWNVNLF